MGGQYGEAVRFMYTALDGTAVIYRQGKKDLFQVAVIRDGQATPPLDREYFATVQANYRHYPRQIDHAIHCFAAWIDKHAGGFYHSICENPARMPDNSHLTKRPPQPFDVESKTFGHQTGILRAYLRSFQDWYERLHINSVAGDLETDLAVIFLGMVAEWYYVSPRGSKSKWQHRMKLLGLRQVTIGGMTPEEAANWSRGGHDYQITPMLEQLNIYPYPFKLK